MSPILTERIASTRPGTSFADAGDVAGELCRASRPVEASVRPSRRLSRGTTRSGRQHACSSKERGVSAIGESDSQARRLGVRRPMTALSAALAVMTSLLSAQLPAQQPATGGNAATTPISLIADASQSMSRARSARTLLRNGRDYIELRRVRASPRAPQGSRSPPGRTLRARTARPSRNTIREAREGLRSSDSTNQAVVARPRQGSARQAGAIALSPSHRSIPPAWPCPMQPVQRVSATARTGQPGSPSSRIEPAAVQQVHQRRGRPSSLAPPARRPAPEPDVPTSPTPQPVAYSAEPSPLVLDENGQVLVSQPLPCQMSPRQHPGQVGPPALGTGPRGRGSTPHPVRSQQAQPSCPAAEPVQPQPESSTRLEPEALPFNQRRTTARCRRQPPRGPVAARAALAPPRPS